MNAASSYTGTFPGLILPSPVASTPPAPPRSIVCPPVIVATAAVAQRHPSPVRPWMFVLLTIFLIIGLAVWWVTGIFRLGSETATLRNSFMSSSAAQWKTKIALNFGRVSFGLVQLGSSFIQMPPEGRAALNSLNQAEVGIYEMTYHSAPLQPGSVLAITDKAMAKRGWVRLVGAVKNENFVAVYAPKKANLKSRIQASVLVLHENRLVVVGARANPNELMKLIPADSFAALRTGIDAHHMPFRF